ncbi:MAG: ribosome maturation factor RimP [Miniphocaeibacter sp.]|uniref:ribosome maturation factor RimP n=1 Tax=Miniphocaeibacter sp. TaxID=3100973 RepID=UPI00182685B9|nr:ribosome maturation factor RimP [Gallicola sp.]
MNKKDLLDLCWKEFKPIVTNLGFILDDIEYVKEPKGNVLRVYIDKDQGTINIDDCEKSSKVISDKLDEIDPIDEQYYLEVSSPGIDRPFKNNRDYSKNIGNLVIVKFYAPVDGEKEIIGKLIDFNDESITLERKDKTSNYERKKIATIRLSIF